MLSFKYIGPSLDRKGGASKEAENRVAKTCSKWIDLTGVTCEARVPMKMMVLMYRTVLYGYNTWSMSSKDEKRATTTTTTTEIYENGAMYNGCEPTGTSVE